MITVTEAYNEQALHDALTLAGFTITGVSTSPSGTIVLCDESDNDAVSVFLQTWQEPAPPTPPPTVEELQAQIAELQNALLDLLIGGA
jgi:hypothetical protein